MSLSTRLLHNRSTLPRFDVSLHAHNMPYRRRYTQNKRQEVSICEMHVSIAAISLENRSSRQLRCRSCRPRDDFVHVELSQHLSDYYVRCSLYLSIPLQEHSVSLAYARPIQIFAWYNKTALFMHTLTYLSYLLVVHRHDIDLPSIPYACLAPNGCLNSQMKSSLKCQF